MSDTGTGSTTAQSKGAAKSWKPSADGSSVAKTYKLEAPGEAVKLAKRALQFAEKDGQAVRIEFSGSEVTIGLAANNGIVGDAQRKFAKRLDGGKGDLPAKAAKQPRDKAAKAAAKAAKAANAKPETSEG